MAQYTSVMWSVWGALVLIVAALKLYTGRLSRDEDDHLILDAAFDNMKAEQAAIVARVHKVEPLTRVFMWLAVAMTVVVIVYYVMDILSHFQ